VYYLALLKLTNLSIRDGPESPFSWDLDDTLNLREGGGEFQAPVAALDAVGENENCESPWNTTPDNFNKSGTHLDNQRSG